MVNVKKIRAANKALKDAKKTFEETMKAVFRESCSELFAENPKLNSFSWYQYTPYFNDGDECIFSACTDYPDINGEQYDTVRYSNWAKNEANKKGEVYVEHELSDVAEKVKSFLREYNTDFYKSVFGDHVRITVKRNGTININDYSEHD